MTTGMVAETAAAVPAVLVTPRWTLPRAEPVVVTGLRCDALPGASPDPLSVLPGGADLSVEFAPGIFVGDPSAYIAQTLGSVRLRGGGFGEQDPIALSEALRDIQRACT